MLDKFSHVWHRDAIVLPGVAHAEEEPVPYRSVCGRVRRVESACHQIYVAVFRGCSSQDDPDGRRRHGQRRDCRAAGHATRGGQSVAPTILQAAIGGPRRESPPGTPSGLSPQSSRLRSRRLRASGRQPWACRCRGSAWPTSLDTRSARAWWPASATARSGVGCTRMRFALGSTAAGSSRAILTSRPRPGGSWTCTNGAGKDRHCATTNSSSPPTRRQASRPACASIRACPPSPASRCALSTSTHAAAPGPTWLRWTCIAPKCSVAVSQAPASRPSSVWSSRS
jgi:hypothetical protein